MATLAIRGHETRGKEVIEILEMLGGNNKHGYSANCDNLCFFCGKGNNIIYYDWVNNRHRAEDTTFFTLEEFIEKYPYKVGDKVIINDCKDDVYTISEMNWNGERIVYKIRDIDGNIDNSVWWECELLPYKEENFAECIENTVQECLFGKEKTMEEKGDKAKAPNLIGEDYSGKRFGYKIPKGYEFDCIKNNEIILKPKQPEYPKNYKECCDVLGINTMDNDAQGYKGGLIICFQELIIARDAYWKIAGEKMGLGKPWEPDFDNENEDKYGIFRSRNIIYKDTTCINPAPTWLIFPTEEMRDAFYENFKSLIEECKELL